MRVGKMNRSYPHDATLEH